MFTTENHCVVLKEYALSKMFEQQTISPLDPEISYREGKKAFISSCIVYNFLNLLNQRR